MLTPRTCAAISQQLGLTTRRQKFNARGVVVDGHRYGSETEYARFCELQRMERVGMIASLRAHPVFLLFGVDGRFVGEMTPDSFYLEDGCTIVEEVKSEATRTLADYRLRLKLLLTCYPTIEYREIAAKTRVYGAKINGAQK